MVQLARRLYAEPQHLESLRLRGVMNLDGWLMDNQNTNILWTNEATFTRVGLNQRNEHLWALNNPHVIRECAHQVRFMC